MKEETIHLNIAALGGAIADMSNSTSEVEMKAAQERLVSAGFGLIVGFLVDLNRIATATERLADLETEKFDAYRVGTYKRG